MARTRVGFLGPLGTFTEQALKSQADLAAAEHVLYRTMPDVLDAVEQGEIDLGFVAIENSIEGTVNLSQDEIAFNHDLLIQREVVLDIEHCLLAKPGQTLDLRAVVAPSGRAAAEIYPAEYWLSMLKIPSGKLRPAEIAEAVRGYRREAEGQVKIARERHQLRAVASLLEAAGRSTVDVAQLLAQHRPRAVIHFAAESHVDRSIHGPGEFIHTNMVGTFSLLEEARAAAGDDGAESDYGLHGGGTAG